MANWDWTQAIAILLISPVMWGLGWLSAYRAYCKREQEELEAVAQTLFGQEEESDDAIYEAYYTDRRGEATVRQGRDAHPRRRRSDR